MKSTAAHDTVNKNTCQVVTNNIEELENAVLLLYFVFPLFASVKNKTRNQFYYPPRVSHKNQARYFIFFRKIRVVYLSLLLTLFISLVHPKHPSLQLPFFLLWLLCNTSLSLNVVLYVHVYLETTHHYDHTGKR